MCYPLREERTKNQKTEMIHMKKLISSKMNMKKILVIIAIGIFLQMFHTTVIAQQRYIWGVEDIEYFPQFSNNKREYLGYASEIFSQFSKYEKISIDYKFMPVKRLYKVFFSGSVDFKYPDNPNWVPHLRNNHTVYYSDPVVEYIDGCMVLSKNLGKGMAHIKTLGTVRGFTVWDYLDQIQSNQIHLTKNNSFIGLLKQLLLERIDCAYINIAVGQYHLRETLKKSGEAIFDPKLPHTRDFYRLSTIHHPKMIERFNRFLKKNTTKVASLRAKYGIHLQTKHD